MLGHFWLYINKQNGEERWENVLQSKDYDLNQNKFHRFHSYFQNAMRSATKTTFSRQFFILREGIGGMVKIYLVIPDQKSNILSSSVV